MKHQYKPVGVCARHIEFELTDGAIHNLNFLDSCHGNSQGLSRLTEGAAAEDVIRRLSGIRCGGRQTSCPDQLARALGQALQEETR